MDIPNTYDPGTTIVGEIICRIKGGFQVKVGQKIGFLPNSKLSYGTIQNQDSYIGKTLEMKIIEYNKINGNFIVSYSDYLQDHRIEYLNNLQIGHQVKGVVKIIKSYGVFVNFGCTDGLIHKSDLTWDQIDDPSRIVKIGEEIEVKVIKINQEEEKIWLSLKHMTDDPWENVEDNFLSV